MAAFEVFADPCRFRDEIAGLVARDPVGATMLTGVLANRIAALPPGDEPLLVGVRGQEGLTVAALRTPGFPLLVTVDPAVRDRPRALRTLVDGVLDLGETVIGLHGRRAVVRELADVWAPAGGAPRPRMSLLLHRLGELVEPTGVHGGGRPLNPADPAEVDLVAQWFARFQEETGVARVAPVPDPDGVRRLLRRGDRFTLWCAGPGPDGGSGRVAVSVAGHSPLRVDGGCRIAPVYTPPRWRRNRFGAAVTAAAVRSALELGAREVTLFTDEDYLPANRLYRSLGFEPVAAFAEYDLPGFQGPTPPAPAR